MGCGGSKSKGGGASNTVPKASTAYEQADGHPGTIKFNGDRITKKTKQSEVQNYNAIFYEPEEGETETSLMKMKPLVPAFYGGQAIENDPKDMWEMTIENLLYGKENASFMDVKMGTSSATLGSNEEKVARRLIKDKKRCSFEHGITICGVNLKNDFSGSKEKVNKLHPPNLDMSR